MLELLFGVRFDDIISSHGQSLTIFVTGFTMGDLARVGGYFKNAGVDLPAENLLSCDTSAIGKPDPAAYKPLLDQLSSQGGTPWFAAAHMWDVSVRPTTLNFLRGLR